MLGTRHLLLLMPCLLISNIKTTRWLLTEMKSVGFFLLFLLRPEKMKADKELCTDCGDSKTWDPCLSHDNAKIGTADP